MGRSLRYAIVGVCLVAVAAFGVVAVAGANGGDTKASLRDAGGKVRGTVTFKSSGGHTEVRVRLVGLPESVARDAFHGFHIHANSDASNGDGCLADATKASNTWFVSADGHWKADAQIHAGHNGDMPSVLVTPDGAAEMRFETGRIDLGQLRGRAVILHAGADNFANVPLGTGDAQYTANTAAAVTATQNTGNAGDRMLCGVIGA
jgi:superoxide dismutase, Cu-Zn family